jgi:hypothetical protein
MALNGTNGNDFFLGTIFDDEVFALRGDDERKSRGRHDRRR